MKLISMVLLVILPITAKAEVGFGKAKKKLYTEKHSNAGKTFYCGCEWSKKKVGLSSCGLAGYFPKIQRKRAKRTEAENIIRATLMLKKNRKARKGVADAKAADENVRKYCAKHDLDVRKAHLVNLVSAAGQIYTDRSNKLFLIQKMRCD